MKMRKLFGVFIGVCLCLCFAICAAEGEWTPPEGKTEGTVGGSHFRREMFYIYGTNDLLQGINRIYAPGRDYVNENSEERIYGNLVFLSGDEACRDMLTWYVEEDGQEWLYQHTGDTVEGDPILHGRFRLELESEHYYVLDEFDATFIPKTAVSVTLANDTIQVPAGRKREMRAFVNPDWIITDPGGIYNRCLIADASGERFTETDEYTVSNPYLEVKKAGRYPMTLYVTTGENEYQIPLQVTIEGISAEEYDAIKGREEAASATKITAAEAFEDEQKEIGETEEEIPGEGSGAGGDGLKLALDNGDREFTVYAGSQRVHLSFWDIVDYEKLKNAWGGEPGWSVMPGEGCPDTVRWSNASKDGKSLWAFYGTAETAAIPGDYTAVLTCSWHGQTASATITLHAVSAPNGLLEGIGGVEESYVIPIGGTIEMDVVPLPAGWSLPGETATIKVMNYRSVLEYDIPGDISGQSYFLTAVDPEGKVQFKALRSGVYTVDIEYSCGTFTEEVTTTINVLNEDGTLPQTANEITETEESAFSYTLEKDPADGKAFAVITGGLAKKNMVIPATVDGYPVRIIGEHAFNARSNLKAGETIETLEISEGVQQIRFDAFHSCKELRSVKLPESLNEIGTSSFADCESLTEVHMPSRITLQGIGNKAFAGIGAEDVVLADGTSLKAESLNSQEELFSNAADGWRYQKLEDGTVRISSITDRFYYELGEELVIPDQLNGYPVSELRERLFRGYSGIRKVTLPESLRVIGAYCFCECENLAEVNLPLGLEEAGKYAFAHVAAEGLTLPESAAERSDSLWYVGLLHFDASGEWEYGKLADGTALLTNLPYVSKIVIPGEVDGIPVSGVTGFSPRGWRSSEGADIVTEIVLPDSLRFIGESAFSMMSNLRKVNLPEGLTEIGNQAFSTCRSLKEIRLPESLRAIAKQAFLYAPLTRLILPEGLETIGESAFAGNELKEISIPESVRNIGHQAFVPGNGKALRKVTFRGPRTEISVGVFGYSYREDDYDVNNPSGWIDVYAEEDPRSAPPKELTIACYPGSTADRLYRVHVKKEYLPWGEEYVRTAPADRVLQAGLYQPEEMIYEVIVPEGVEEIAEGAFAGLTTLSKVTLPSTLTVIGSRAFEGCAVLKDMKNGAKVLLSIGDKAFSGCESLAKFELKKGLETIGEEAFLGTALTKAEIPDTVTAIGKGAFAHTQINSITFPKGLEDIPENVCYGAVYLKTIKLPAAVKTIGSHAFAYCIPTTLNLPEGLVSIGESAFCYDASYVQQMYVTTGGKTAATALKSLKVPASLQAIGTNAFACNDALVNVTFTKGSCLAEIGAGAFAMCVRLKEMNLPDSVREIGANAFTNCIGLVKVNLGKGLIRLGAEAFMYDTAMTSLTVPDTVTELGEKILEGCTDRLTVHCGEGSAMEIYVQDYAPDVKSAR